MNHLRVTSAVLICASLMTGLAACAGGQDAATTAGPTSPASAAPSSAATTPAMPSPSPAAETTAGKSDKELCTAAKKAGDDMKAELVAAVRAGDTSPAMFRKVLTKLNEKVTALAATGGDSKVTAALEQFGAEAAKAAAAADPADAADNPAFEKSGKVLTAACKAAGVSVNF